MKKGDEDPYQFERLALRKIGSITSCAWLGPHWVKLRKSNFEEKNAL